MSYIIIIIRIIKIFIILIKYNVTSLFLPKIINYLLRSILYINPNNWNILRTNKMSIKAALVEMGPIFVKLGQSLSMRYDLLPVFIVEDLQKLQDKVSEVSFKKVKSIIESDLQKSVNDIFSYINHEPIASASIAQVHVAKLHNGCEVVVKVKRPGVEKQIQTDIKLLHKLSIVFANTKLLKDFKVSEIVSEFDITLEKEMDFSLEASNASQIKRNCAKSNIVYIPKIYWDYTRRSVLVMERVSGIKISDIETLKKNNINLKKVASKMYEMFVIQAFNDRLFHADLHPGNLFVSFDSPNDPIIIAVDFGIVGSLSENDRFFLVENFKALCNKDFRKVAKLHQQSAWINTTVDLFYLESSIRAICEPILECPIKDISFALLLSKLIKLARRFNFNIQPQLILLQKTLFSLEGISRNLHPELNVLDCINPYLMSLNNTSFKKCSNDFNENLSQWMKEIHSVPKLISNINTLIDRNFNNNFIYINKNIFTKIINRRLIFGILVGIGISSGLFLYCG